MQNRNRGCLPAGVGRMGVGVECYNWLWGPHNFYSVSSSDSFFADKDVKSYTTNRHLEEKLRMGGDILPSAIRLRSAPRGKFTFHEIHNTWRDGSKTL